MNLDVLVAFGGVALIGGGAFLAAWFSLDVEGPGKSKAQQKRLVVARIAQVEEELHSLSSKIAGL